MTVLLVLGGVSWLATRLSDARSHPPTASNDGVFPFEATVKGVSPDDTLPKLARRDKADIQNLLRLQKESDGTDAYNKALLGFDEPNRERLEIGTRVKVLSEALFTYADIGTKYAEIEVLTGEYTGKHLFIATAYLSDPAGGAAPAVSVMTPATSADGNACANACFFRTSHELESKGLNPNDQQGETWVKCFKECGVSP